MKSSTNGVAAVRQRERLIGALKPLPPGAEVKVTPSLLALLRPVREFAPGPWTHGFARLDVSGRIRDSVVFKALGWNAGTLVLLRREDERLIGEASAEGWPLDSRGRLLVPETERRALSLHSHEGVLLSAHRKTGVLVVTPACLCDELVS
jgi:hypothetical protein